MIKILKKTKKTIAKIKKVVYNKGNYVIGAIPIQNLTYSFGGNYGSSWRF